MRKPQSRTLFSIFATVGLLAVLTLAIYKLCASRFPHKVALHPAIMYQGELYFESGPSIRDLHGSNMLFIGEITSLTQEHELPKKEWQGNYGTLLNGKVFLSTDGTLHLLLTNGRQIEMVRIEESA